MRSGISETSGDIVLVHWTLVMLSTVMAYRAMWAIMSLLVLLVHHIAEPLVVLPPIHHVLILVSMAKHGEAL